MKSTIKRKTGSLLLAICAAVFMTTVSATAATDENSTKKTEEITGTVYEFSKKEAYDFEEKTSTDAAKYVGFSINGELTAEGEKNGVAAYAAVGGDPGVFQLQL